MKNITHESCEKCGKDISIPELTCLNCGTQTRLYKDLKNLFKEVFADCYKYPEITDDHLEDISNYKEKFKEKQDKMMQEYS